MEPVKQQINLQIMNQVWNQLCEQKNVTNRNQVMFQIVYQNVTEFRWQIENQMSANLGNR